MFRTAIPLWRQTTQIPSRFSPKRDCGPERVGGFRGWGIQERAADVGFGRSPPPSLLWSLFISPNKISPSTNQENIPQHQGKIRTSAAGFPAVLRCTSPYIIGIACKRAAHHVLSGRPSSRSSHTNTSHPPASQVQ